MTAKAQKLPGFGTRPHGFTLVELMVVVAVIALLTAIALPNFIRARQSAQNSTFINDLRVSSQAFQMYNFENRTYPPNTGPGLVPNGMAPYLANMRWNQSTPLGGKWNYDNNLYGYTLGVGVYQPTAPIEQLTRIDVMLDDGDLSTGSFRTRPNGYVLISE